MEVPKGTHAAFFTSSLNIEYEKEYEVLLVRNYYYQYQSAIIVTTLCRETMLVEVDLIDKK